MMKEMKKVLAPWTPEQVERLAAWQQRDDVHPFTCTCGNVLTPCREGWRCEADGHYAYSSLVQTWAWDLMMEKDPFPRRGVAYEAMKAMLLEPTNTEE